MNQLLDFVQNLSFVRVAGSDEEKRAADLIVREIEVIRADENTEEVDASEVMPFTFPSAVVRDCHVHAMGRELPCAPYLRSGNIDKPCRLLFLDAGSEADFAGIEDLSDTAVLLSELTDEETYERLVKHHAAAFLIPKGKFYQSFEETSTYARELREHFTKYGIVPGFQISSADATELIQTEVETITLKLAQENVEKNSQNVIAVIRGTQFPNESIALTAHYDSVPVGTGAWDNATGATALLEIYRHFAQNPPKRTMRFIWCGSEEVGLRGSRAYVDQHTEDLEEIKFCFNFDMCGTALGPNRIFITGEKELDTYVDQFCKKYGYFAKTNSCVHSSDSAPFCDHGIPALGLSRGTSAAEIHTIHDLIPPLDETAFRKNIDFAILMIDDIANSVLLPIKRSMPDERKKELDKYFHRKETETNTK